MTSELFALEGWRPDPTGIEIKTYEPTPAALSASEAVKPSDLRPFSTYREDQKRTNSCVAQSLTKALEVRHVIEQDEDIQLSAMYLYYVTRQRMNPPETNKDFGTYIWLAADTIRTLGVCREDLWPYRAKSVFEHPNWGVMRNAYEHRIKGHYKITSIGSTRVRAVQLALTNQYPVVFGAHIGANWTRYKGGVIEPVGKAKTIGGHAMVLLGWDGENFIGENSWGEGWGERGWFRCSPQVIKEAFDLWVIV